jgi:hypothetical protein
MQETDLQQQLERLCAHPDFQQLQQSLRRFDPFKVLKVERYELRHTTTLAWLLDPEQTHGLGDGFLRRFLERTCGSDLAPGPVAVQAELRLSGGALHAPVTASEEEDSDSGSAARKTGELDVLIESAHWAVAIEAKIDSREGQDQLLDYSRYLQRRFGDAKPVRRLYLTVQPDQDVIDANPGWTGIQWGAQVAGALRAALQARYGAALEQALDDCPPDERALCEFLQRYLHLLERLDDTAFGAAGAVQALADAFYQPLTALREQLRRREDANAPILPWLPLPDWARRYWEHRQLFDLLIGRLRSPEASFATEVLKQLGAAGDMALQRLDGEGGKRATFRFVPAAWMGWQIELDDHQAPLHTLMFYHVAYRNTYQDIEIKLLLPKVAEHALQVRLVERLLAQQQAHGTRSLKPNPTYLGVFLASTGSSLKLYSDKLGWQLDDGGHTLSAGADDQIKAFWKAVTEHTALLEKIMAQPQA